MPITDQKTGSELLRTMMLIRQFEQSAAEQYTLEKIRGFLHLYNGEEAVATGIMYQLKPEDRVLSTYREHGHAIARGVDTNSLMAELFGKVEGCSKGRGGSMHLFDVSKNFYGGNAIVAGHLPVAAGLALAEKKLKTSAISCCFFGEGAAAEGAFHETMNLSALLKVPALFILENNLYAMGTAINFSHSQTDFKLKASGYGIDSTVVDGMDLNAVNDAGKQAVDFVRSRQIPFLLICNTYRFRAHSMFDAELYRKKEEVETWKKRDPVVLFQNYLIENNLINKDDISNLENQVKSEIINAVSFAESGKSESAETLLKHEYYGA